LGGAEQILADVRQVLKISPVFRGHSCRLTSIYYRHQEEKCFRVDVNGHHTPYKLRLVTETSGRSAANEYEALKILHSHHITWAPAIVDYRATGPAYLVTTFVEGRSLDTGTWWLPQCVAIRQQISDRVGEMHRLTGRFYGHVGGTRYPTWRQFLDVRFWEHVHRCETEMILSAGDVRLLERLYEDGIRSCDGIEAHLLHGDIKPANLVVAPDGRCNLIDFEITRYGDPDFEWVKMRWLSLRWPEYRRHVAGHVLTGKLPHDDFTHLAPKFVLYAVYHVCAILQFERDVNIRTPTYRYQDLRALLDLVRSRYG
jgi:serine/threonine protein kinase